LKIIIFSKNRPLQLDLCLKTFQKFCGDARIQDVTVLYKIDPEYKNAYETLMIENSWYGYQEETNFQQNVLDLLMGHEQILFLCDDTIFYKTFNLIDPCKALEKDNDMLGFSFRLGENTNFCYPTEKPQAIPDVTKIKKNIVKYCWPGKEWDFGYPLEVSSSLFSIKTIMKCLKDRTFDGPNSLEDCLVVSMRFFLEKPWLGMFSNSVAFANPLNRIQDSHKNRFSELEKYNPTEMLRQYENGIRVDLNILKDIKINGAHQIVELY
jgi:hypothetical protein